MTDNVQATIIQTLNVKSPINPAEEARFRIDFIKNQLHKTKCRALVLGISGGIDSTVTGRLCQLAVEELRHEGYDAKFIAMRLPYHIQKDEHEAQLAIDFIQADQVLTVNIHETSDAALQALLTAGLQFDNEKQHDFILGNIKARQRMLVQYAVASQAHGLVVGTDHAAEALVGFFTKFGDGACDIAPLTGLTKRQVRSLGAFLQAPEILVTKCPTADLETLCPLLPDEVALGVTYEDIDNFLEGNVVDNKVYDIIYRKYQATEHKRQLPVTPTR